MKSVLAFAAALVLAAAPLRAPAQAHSATLDGKWHFVMDTEGGDRESEAEFAVDPDGKVTGTFGKDKVAGTFKDGKMSLSFKITSEEAGITDDLKFDGKIDDSGNMTGTWAFSSYSGTFKASHPAAAPPPATPAAAPAGPQHIVN
jgi:hypothetical protein